LALLGNSESGSSGRSLLDRRRGCHGDGIYQSLAGVHACADLDSNRHARPCTGDLCSHAHAHSRATPAHLGADATVRASADLGNYFYVHADRSCPADGVLHAYAFRHLHDRVRAFADPDGYPHALANGYGVTYFYIRALTHAHRSHLALADADGYIHIFANTYGFADRYFHRLSHVHGDLLTLAYADRYIDSFTDTYGFADRYLHTFAHPNIYRHTHPDEHIHPLIDTDSVFYIYAHRHLYAHPHGHTHPGVFRLL
jgi:hypothetical protein